ncbi:MAG: phosphomethylpyrimidine synthase ThiC [Desulfotignum sp.]|nr:phosphomethylpyrimidine synthase ThiC [Desulfotignum sp.]
MWPEGRIVIPCNPNRKHQKIVGIGKGLRTEVNASIGTSSDICDIRLEAEKGQGGTGRKRRHPHGIVRSRRHG